MWPSFNKNGNAAKNDENGRVRYTLWIDGIGSFLLCLHDRVTIGGPNLNAPHADLPLLASLSSCHATIIRSQEGYLIHAHGPAKVFDNEIHERTHLNDDYEISLGGTVRLRFRLPTELSSTATLSFVSDHRPARSVDGVVLMDDTCLMGPGSENHIQCPDWPGSVLLYRKGDQVWCKSRLGLFVGNKQTTDGLPLENGQIVTGPDLRFHLERE